MVTAHRTRRSTAIGRRVLELVFAAVTALAFVALPAAARAEDRIATLNRMLGSSSEKVRMSAVLALAKLGEPRVDKPLIRALRDPSPRVRIVAAAALGQLDCGAALPALRTLARSDDDPDVRRTATTATMKLTGAGRAGERAERAAARAGGHPADRAADAEVAARRTSPGGERGERASHAAFSAEPHPDLYVLVNSASDESPGAGDPATRKAHAEIIKRTLLDQLRSDPSITSAAGDAQRWALDARHLDLSVIRLAASRTGDVFEIDAQLRVAISDDSGKMLSLLSGGAKVQVPAAKFDTRYLPALRKEALDNAMRGMFVKLIGQLRDQP
ncbi:MAG TPA: HEAT repeat domain-containing protein [Kofleriaceae bacterium]|nr:HEAT repeat domain-containing protein [Kofleriaceae bacterium]